MKNIVRRVIKIVKITLMVVAILFISYQGFVFYKKAKFVDHYVATPVVVPAMNIPSQSDIDVRIEDVKKRAEFRTKMSSIEKSQATNIAISELKAEAKKQYDEAMAKYEKGLEGVRKADLSLQ